MFSHITMGTNDIAAAGDFYDQVLGAIGLKRTEDMGSSLFYGTGKPGTSVFIITTPYDQQPASVGNGTHVAFIAPRRSAVDEFHRIALEIGGTSEGEPGLRPHYSANYYSAYIRDLDGNKLQAVCYKKDQE